MSIRNSRNNSVMSGASIFLIFLFAAILLAEGAITGKFTTVVDNAEESETVSYYALAPKGPAVVDAETGEEVKAETTESAGNELLFSYKSPYSLELFFYI